MIKVLFVIIVLSVSITAQTTHTVCASGCDYTNLQTAINDAARGDTIEVEAGETFTGNFVLTYKASGSGYITIQSSALASLPAAGNRVAPSDASNMPTIRSANAAGDSTFSTTSGSTPSAYYKLIGLNIQRHNSTSQQTSIITLGSSDSTQDNLTEEPNNIVIDRCIISGAESASTRNAIVLNARNVTITSNYIEKIFALGFESHGIVSWNGSGEWLIANNYIEAASINMLVGGATPNITALIPTNVVFEHNYCFKPLSWVGAGYGVKNLFELKIGRNATVRNNIFENSWADAQTGYGILFTVRSEGVPTAVIEDVLFEYNIVKNVGNGFQVLVQDDSSTSGVMNNVTVRHNLILSAGSVNGGNGLSALINHGQDEDVADALYFLHNTFILNGTGGSRRLQFEGIIDFLSDFRFNDNIVASEDSDAGAISWSADAGTAALNGAAGSGDWQFNNNVYQRSATGNPSSSFYTTTFASIGFENAASDDFSLSAGSTYKNDASDGTDPGVNWSQLQSRTANVVAGTGWSQSGGTQRIKISGGTRLRGVRL